MRVTDAFMMASEADANWSTHAVTTGETVETFKARKLLRQMAEAAHLCGDPGIQYDTTINKWNPVKASGRINSSNPCSEYMFLDDTACNLASLNLMTFVDDEGEFQVEAYRAAVAITILAHGDHRRPGRLPDARRSGRTATCTARSGSATRTSARC